jgi:hypothetical protein
VRPLRLLLAAAILASAPPASAQEFVWRQPSANEAFQPGEKILYVIKYGFVPSGFATLEVPAVETVNGRPAYHIVSRAKTNKGTDIFFKVRDRNESWMDVESLCSLRFHQNLREGFHRRQTRTDYDHPAGRFVYWKKRKGKEYTEEGGIPAFVQDVLSSLYYIRTQPLEVGKDYTLDVNSGGKTWPLKVHVKRKKKVRVPAGKFDCLHIEPILAGEGIFQQEGKLEVWLTDDHRKIPVLMRSRVMVGAFDAEMKKYIEGGAADGEGLPEVESEPEEDEGGDEDVTPQK